MGNNTTPAGQAALGIASGFISGGLSDLAQYGMQGMYNQQALGQSKALMDYQEKKQLEMWKATSYPAQVEQLKAAGLNPGLIYANGGSGGTTGSISATQSAPQPTNHAHDVTTMGGMGIQAGIAEAQIENLKAQTHLTEVEAQKAAGVDTSKVSQDIEESKTRQESLLQGIDVQKEDWVIKRLQQTMMNIQNYEQQKSQTDRLQTIQYNAQQAYNALEILRNESKVSDATVNDKIKIVQQEAIGAALKNFLTQAQTAKTGSDIQVNNEQIQKMANEIMMNWDYQSNDNQRLTIEKTLAQWNTDPNREALQQILHLIPHILVMPTKLK
jgi:hypothetical protein